MPKGINGKNESLVLGSFIMRAVRLRFKFTGFYDTGHDVKEPCVVDSKRTL
jgi:hypothetical protein